jgi:hypothetical protein
VEIRPVEVELFHANRRGAGWTDMMEANTLGCARTKVIVSGTSFVIASVRSSIYTEIYVFRGNPFQAHSLEQSYHKRYVINNRKLIYLTFIYCTCKFEKHTESFLREN